MPESLAQPSPLKFVPTIATCDLDVSACEALAEEAQRSLKSDLDVWSPLTGLNGEVMT